MNINNRIEYLNLSSPKKLYSTIFKLILASLFACVTFTFKRIFTGPTKKSWSIPWDYFIQIQKAVWNKLPDLGTIEFRNAADSFVSFPKGITRKIENVNGVRVERFSNSNHNDITILYFHGGGYIFGSPATSTFLISGIIGATQSELLLVDYRLAPENTWPCPIDESFMVYNYLLKKGKNPKKTIFLGDSAGGNLCLMLLLKLRSRNLPYPASAVAVSPWVDLSNTGESFERNASFDYVTKEACDLASKQFVKENDPKSPEISPIYADLRGMPKLLILAGECEVLVDQISDFAKKAKQAEVDVQYSIYKDMIHDWLVLPDITKNAEIAFKEISDFLKHVTNT